MGFASGRASVKTFDTAPRGFSMHTSASSGVTVGLDPDDNGPCRFAFFGSKPCESLRLRNIDETLTYHESTDQVLDGESQREYRSTHHFQGAECSEAGITTLHDLLKSQHCSCTTLSRRARIELADFERYPNRWRHCWLFLTRENPDKKKQNMMCLFQLLTCFQSARRGAASEGRVIIH